MANELISQTAISLIVATEVGDIDTPTIAASQKQYQRKYRKPEWPGGASGITIGIGYDVGAGVSSKKQLHADWDGQIPDVMIKALEPCIGKTGARAKALLPGVRRKVDVPWAAAMHVFLKVDVPRWYAICKKALPNFESLPADWKGALVSLAYNRGASFSKAGPRFKEMRSIKSHMRAKQFDAIPADFRAMKRLWRGSASGLVKRREKEAVLFEKGLKAK
jgi:hypothetical protein